VELALIRQQAILLEREWAEGYDGEHIDIGQ
jgi:hypothetical protein